MALGLATIPLDTQLEILAWIPDFHTLHSSLLINRSLSQLFTEHRALLTRLVAQNYFGDLLDDALILANTQINRNFSDPKDHGYKSTLIARLLSNEDVNSKNTQTCTNGKNTTTPIKRTNLRRAQTGERLRNVPV
ncbi:hypothetical protein B0H16DRAFT_1471056 [Mycena metata]|uniref:F-box domain-containing protein n=1 Tax=Mycena metata TaxID=1033252 RepID=A0AAD7HSC0_9AGAR|nr:hypothetical protein B0H16DRAFT_1471056 [Mycena metata]